MTEPARILVVEDDSTVADVVRRYLEREGHQVGVVGNGRLALERAKTEMPDLVMLDIMLPGIDGFEVCRRLRELGQTEAFARRRSVGIIMLTARGQEADRVMGLELGADDYLPKPFSPRELVARVHSVLRRLRAPEPAHRPAAEPLVAGRIELDERSRAVRVGGQPITLTVREFDLLAFMMRHPREAFRRETLLEQVWGYSFGDTSTVTVHVRRLREKVETDPAEPVHVQTVWGVGYRFEPEPVAAPALGSGS